MARLKEKQHRRPENSNWQGLEDDVGASAIAGNVAGASSGASGWAIAGAIVNEKPLRKPRRRERSGAERTGP